MANLFVNDVKKQERNFGNYWREIQIFKQPEGTCTFERDSAYVCRAHTWL